jgi:hypothetical protein
MIDLQTEQLLLLANACDVVPGRPHVSTLIRWWRDGVRGVKLETVVVGGRRFTSIEAVHRFISRLSEPRSVRNATAITDRKLDDEGIR